MKNSVPKRCLMIVSLCLILVAAAGSAVPPKIDKSLETYLKVFPEVKSIGVIYSRADLEPAIRQLESGARAKKIKLVKISSPTIKEFPDAVTQIKDQVDTIWVLDDPLYSVQDVWAFFLFFTIRNNLKTVVSTGKALSEGGLFYYNDLQEVVINRRMLNLLRLKVSSNAGEIKYYEPD